MPEVTTWEGMHIPLPPDIEPRWFADRLIRLTDSAPFTAFRWKRGGLYAAEVVGCVQLGRIRINILPKLDTPELDRDKSFLLNLLRSAGYLSYLHQGVAEVRAETLDPLEAMISEIAIDIANALREGYPRRYEEYCEDSPALRGRIDFTRLSTRLPGSATIPIRHSPLGINNGLAQVIKGIATFLHRITRNAVSRQRLGAVLSSLSLVKSKVVSVAQVDAIVLSRYEMHWSRTLAVGRLLLSGQSPDPTFGGNNQAFSLLFPMQHLYERALRKILVTAIAGSGIKVNARSEPIFLFVDTENQSGVVRLRPDYVFSRGGEPIAIADAKWKRASEGGAAHGTKREDFYQIHAYLTRYKVSEAVILVPRAPWMPEKWIKSYSDADTDAQVHLIGVDIEGLVGRSAKARDASYKSLAEMLGSILPP
ncbi:McrC family protein [Pseudomonas corrugata]|uniref:McrC family protein n=1 Tax=Pseudomonas corrugata TaxID=47879 RepID=UPI0022345513|nr:McrC family protein [Pseudomonas corrugata]UZE05023.1 McrC family protein [Pseudomonas corrugata]